jgi:hypothetical protein
MVMQAEVLQGSILSLTLYNMYLTTGVYLSLLTTPVVIFSEKCSAVSLSSMEERCERWNININKVRTQSIYFSHRIRPPESHLTLNEWNIPFVNSVKYFGVIFDVKITWMLQIELNEAKVFRTFIRIYSLFKREQFKR